MQNKLLRKRISEDLYKCRNEKNYEDNFIKIVNEYLEKYEFESDEDFLFIGRKKFLFDEFNDYLTNNNLNDDRPFLLLAFGNLEEFICNDNFLSMRNSLEERNINDRYSSKGYICLEEKIIIEQMLNKIKCVMKDKDRFVWNKDDIQIFDSLCELCIHNNNGKKDSVCNNKIINNECPNFEKKDFFEESKLSFEEIENIMNEIFDKDANGKYKNLQLKNVYKEKVYTGKSYDELTSEEKKYLDEYKSKLQDFLKEISLKDIKAIKIGLKVLKISNSGIDYPEILFYSKKLDDGLLYSCIPVRGGGAVIIDPVSNEFLFASSRIDFDTHLKEYKNGRRTKL